MKYFSICLAFLLGTFSGHSQSLFKITQNGKFGFIDSTGKIIIKPIYAAAGNFSNGLCPVRKGPYYGFINTNGKMTITQKFDYAETFSEGVAEVYIGNKKYFVDPKGNIPHYKITKKGNYKYISTGNGYEGVMNIYGKLIIDTVFTKIVTKKNGYFLLENSAGVGVMDSTGAWYLDHRPWRFEFHRDFPSSVFYTDPVINPEIAKLNKKLNEFASARTLIYQGEPIAFLNDTLVLVTYSYKDRFGKMPAHGNLYVKTKRGAYLMSTNGNMYMQKGFYHFVANRKNTTYLTHHINCMEFIDSTGHHFFFNADLKPISQREYELKKSPIDRYKIFNFNDSSFIYDQNCQLTFSTSHHNAIKYFDSSNLFFMRDYSGYTDSLPEDWNYPYGIINYRGEWLSKPFIPDVDGILIKNNLIYCPYDTNEVYYSIKGQKIYEGPRVNPYRTRTDIDFKDAINFTYEDYFDRLKNNKTDEKYISLLSMESGNEDSIRNAIIQYNKDLDSNAFIFKLSLDKKTVSLACNASFSPLCFMIDEALAIEVEAKDKSGNWYSITFPDTDCGNSFHFGSIHAGKIFENQPIPQYQGGIKTSLRLVLKVYPKNEHYPQINYHSETFNGYINPAQLWRYEH